jgi:glycosyltransferase involved in cell wall biosynthesis
VRACLTKPKETKHKVMRACMVAYTFYEADNRVRRYAETLAKRGDKVDAIALRREGQPAFEVIRGVRVYRVQKRVIDERGPFGYLRKLLLFFLRSAWMLALQHLKAPYDIIHVHSVPDFEVFATIVPRLLGAKVILDIHDIVPEFYASKFKVSENSLAFRLLVLMEKLSIAYSNHVIISNHLWHAKITKRSVRPEKCTAIINYPDPSIFSRRPRPLPANGDFVMCYPGTLNWHQGLDLAIDAVALLRDKAPHLKFLIIGDGPDREKIRTTVQRERLEERVTLKGFIPLEQVADIMATIDLGVVPKRKDSFGNEAFSTKIMEFMAMGVPVVASRTRIDEYYFNERLLQFFESESAEDLAAKILELIEDPAKCGTLRTHATEFIQKNNWDVKKNEYLDLVDRLVKREDAIA